MHEAQEGIRRAWVWVGLALFLGLLASALLAIQHHRLLQGTMHDAQLSQVDRVEAAITQQLGYAALLTRSVQSLFLASDEVTPEEFQLIYENLQPREAFPSLLAFAYAERVAQPGRPDRYPTTMVAPLEGNEQVIGLDVMSQPGNLAAVMRSRDTDEPVVSAAFTLVQTGGDGLIIRLPVFMPGSIPDSTPRRREQMVGSLGISFHARGLIAAALDDELTQAFDLLVVDEGVVDQVGEGGDHVLFGLDRQAGESPLHVRHIEFGSRRWRLELQPRAQVWQGSQWPWLTFAVMGAASILLALLVWSLLATRERALGLASVLSSRFRDSEARFRRLNDLLPALVLLLRGDQFLTVYANHAAVQKLGTDATRTGHPLAIASPQAQLGAQLRSVLASGVAVDAHPMEILGAAGPFWASVSATRVELDGELHVLVLANDISELRELNQQLGYQASHDPLTDMLNRREFERRLAKTLEVVGRGEATAALLYLDLDQFKLINDTCGHAAGDQMLAEVSRLLKASVASGDVLARLGGDEFGVLLQRTGADDAVAVGERLRESIESFVFAWERRNFSLSVSIGAVVLDRAGLSLREVLSQADQACYMAKERGRNKVQLYVESDAETVKRRSEMEWVNRVRETLKEDRMCLDYQRIEPARPSRRTSGVHLELLVRMRDRDGQAIQPGAFIPAAERFGLMPQVDRWVVETALANFDRLLPDADTIELCTINLSGLTVDDDAFAGHVLSLLERYPVPPHKLCFEITETVAVNNMSRVVAFMQRLRQVGCRFALDDFGAGAASFGYLKNMPIDIIKIDGSFIRNLETDPVSYSIVRAVTDIGHQIGLEVVAEWVDSERTRELLRGLGVDYVQGFHIHRPEPTTLSKT